MSVLARQQFRFAIQTLVALVALLALANGTAGAFPITWSLSEFQPNVPNGGRANSIAVNPVTNNDIFVASESGGLFHSTDRGITWHHVDAVTPYYLGAVAFVPGFANILIATARDDFTAGNDGGGIWRSTDGGATWSHVANPTLPPGAARFSASELSIAPDTGDIYAATSAGIAHSVDHGASWTSTSPFGGYLATSVVAQPGGLVLAGTYYGIARSTNAGSTWSFVTGSPTVADMHGLAGSPIVANTLYAVSTLYTPPVPPATAGTLTMQLFVTEDSGVTWTAIPGTTTGGDSCGGIGFVKPIVTLIRRIHPFRIDSKYTLWFGDRCQLRTLIALPISGTSRFDYTGSWTPTTIPHSDTRDLAFTTGNALRSPSPLLMANDGGLLSTSDGGATWSFTGGGVNGYNALQVTEVKGQRIDNPPHYDLYYGTQDNDSRATRDFDTSWPPAICCEGFFIEMQKHVSVEADSQVTFVSCGACVNLLRGAQFSALANWVNPPVTPMDPDPAGNPAIIGQSFQVQGVNDSGGLSKGFAVTQNFGTTWSQYATFPEDRRDIPKLSRSWRPTPFGRRMSLPVQYQAIRTGFDSAHGVDIVHLVRLSKNRVSATASVYYPAMNGFGSLGINPTMFAWYEVFAVDPSNSSHLIAPDIFNQKIMESHDGGDNWSEIPGLTNAVSDNGRFNFGTWIFPQASAVSFDADDSNMVALGTQANGLFLSQDGAASWTKVPGSENATYITSVEWHTALDAFVSTYGRGLWRLTGRIYVPKIPQLCEIMNCLIKYIDRGDPPPDYEHGIIIFEGTILGARAEHGVLREIFVSPGSSIGFTGRDQKIPQVKVTETRSAMRFEGLPRIGSANLGSPKSSRMPRPAGALAVRGAYPNVVGFALDAKGMVVGAAYSAATLPLTAAMPKQPEGTVTVEREDRSRSPTTGKPYAILTVPGGSSDRVEPGQRITVQVSALGPRTAVNILLDGKVVSRAEADRIGAVRADIIAPLTFGLHTIRVNDITTKATIDGTMFIVRHNDARPENR